MQLDDGIGDGIGGETGEDNEGDELADEMAVEAGEGDGLADEMGEETAVCEEYTIDELATAVIGRAWPRAEETKVMRERRAIGCAHMVNVVCRQ